MIVRQSTSFQRTLRQAPAEAETDNHALLLRAGLVDQLAAGIYSYLPMGWRVFRKVEQIIREEMDASGGQELMLPVLHPIELWEQSGRRQEGRAQPSSHRPLRKQNRDVSDCSLPSST